MTAVATLLGVPVSILEPSGQSRSPQAVQAPQDEAGCDTCLRELEGKPIAYVCATGERYGR